MRILVVDGDFQARTLMQRHLYPYGFVDIATDGEEAVVAFQQALKEREPYDLIVLDVCPPGDDAQATVREVRDIEKEWDLGADKAVRIIMMSSHANSEELQDAFFFGRGIGYLVKPVAPAALFREIETLGLELAELSEASAV